jgi:hypothetical protein
MCFLVNVQISSDYHIFTVTLRRCLRFISSLQVTKLLSTRHQNILIFEGTFSLISAELSTILLYQTV